MPAAFRRGARPGRARRNGPNPGVSYLGRKRDRRSNAKSGPRFPPDSAGGAGFSPPVVTGTVVRATFAYFRTGGGPCWGPPPGRPGRGARGANVARVIHRARRRLTPVSTIVKRRRPLGGARRPGVGTGGGLLGTGLRVRGPGLRARRAVGLLRGAGPATPVRSGVPSPSSSTSGSGSTSRYTGVDRREPLVRSGEPLVRSGEPLVRILGAGLIVASRPSSGRA